jgi:hypothetical protein
LYLLSIDPGKSSGIFLGHYSDTEPLTRVAVWQVEGGMQGLLDWFEANLIDHREPLFGLKLAQSEDTVYVAEKFTPLQNQGFSLTLDAVEPLRCEGALIALGLLPAEFPHNQWQRPNMMYWIHGTSLAEKKKASRAWLKTFGLLPTGKDVGCKDANDAVSASLHAFAYMRKIRHTPSIERYWSQTERSTE